MPEKKIGKYQVIRLLGSGGFGDVFLVHDPILDRKWALKVSSGVGDKGEALLKEAKLTLKLTHPHIVHLHDAFFEGLNFCMVMEYCPGGSLAQRIRAASAEGSAYKPERAASIALVIVEALDYAHSRRVLHRDVKPGNILFGEEDIPKLSDFGIARILEDAHGAASTRIGSVPYMAPEHLLGRATFQSDIFSAGAVLYEMLTSKRAFPGSSDYIVMKSIESGSLTPPRQINASIPKWLEAVTLKALAQDPADRFAGAGKMAEALRTGLGGKPVEVTPPPERKEPVLVPAPSYAEGDALEEAPSKEIAPKPKKKRGVGWFFAVMLLIAALTGLGVGGKYLLDYLGYLGGKEEPVVVTEVPIEKDSKLDSLKAKDDLESRIREAEEKPLTINKVTWYKYFTKDVGGLFKKGTRKEIGDSFLDLVFLRFGFYQIVAQVEATNNLFNLEGFSGTLTFELPRFESSGTVSQEMPFTLKKNVQKFTQELYLDFTYLTGKDFIMDKEYQGLVKIKFKDQELYRILLNFKAARGYEEKGEKSINP